MRTGKQRQREETAAETEVGGFRVGGTGPGIIISKWQVIWGNNRNTSGARRQDAAKWSASAKWENDASLLSTVTQNVPSQKKKC